MQSQDSPRHRGEVLLVEWRGSDPLVGIPDADWSHCNIRQKECPRFTAIYRNLEYFAAPDCNLTESLFAHCNLNHSDFQRVVAPHSSWHSSFLEQARLNAIRAPQSNFCQAHMRSTSLQRASIQRSTFSYANLLHANLQQADLRWCDFRATNLRYAKIDGATLTGAKINNQTKEYSDWSTNTVQQWIDAGAQWTDCVVEPTRFSPGIDVHTNQSTSLNVADAFNNVCKPKRIAVVGGAPELFIATLDVEPKEIIEHILQIASQSSPPTEILRSKWSPLNEWLRKGGVLTPWIKLSSGITAGIPTKF